MGAPLPTRARTADTTQPGSALRDEAERFLRTARAHKSCRAASVASVASDRAEITLDLHVEMPLHMKVDGVSPNGVRAEEPVLAVLSSSFPWSVPEFFLRQDFPRSLPHLQPDPETDLPRPCLVDGSQREFFFQFGLVEAGLFHLIDQLALWLRRAALGTLIDPAQGWEPALRRDLEGYLVMNAEAARALVDRRGGYRCLDAAFHKVGPAQGFLNGEARAFVSATPEPKPLKRDDTSLFTSGPTEHGLRGDTVVAVIWPDKLPSGRDFVADEYLPETVRTLGDLRHRAGELGCSRSFEGFVSDLERCFAGFNMKYPVPLGIVVCARRPCHLIGSNSAIELLPYLIEFRAAQDRTSLFAKGDAEPVALAQHLDRPNAALLRTLPGAPEISPSAVLGCGSVGSKMAMHLARAGAEITAVSDRSNLLPHNMARHALARAPLPSPKAEELAAELNRLGQKPLIHLGDLVSDLPDREKRRSIFPPGTSIAINTTASLAVREALSVLAARDLKPRLVEAALFGEGRGGFLLAEGQKHNPTLNDLAAELYALADHDPLRALLFHPAHGLSEVQIGQGCGSLTMRMTDMRLSAMTAGLAEEIVRIAGESSAAGEIVVATTDPDSPQSNWRRYAVPPVLTVPIDGAEGWTVRLSARVAAAIKEEIDRWPAVETGGVMIGQCSARLRAITVVDLLPAPPDSVRSAARLVLGTQGLRKAITARHEMSGRTLIDLGTWHSHLSDEGPSPLDRTTAAKLARERPPPSALLIVTPNRRYGLMDAG